MSATLNFWIFPGNFDLEISVKKRGTSTVNPHFSHSQTDFNLIQLDDDVTQWLIAVML